MKLLLFILALTLSQIPAQTTGEPGGYSPIDASELNQDQNIQDILSFGARHVVEQGIDDGKLEDADYEVTAVYSASKQVVNGINYKFDVEIRNNEGTIIRASYVVYDQAWTNTREVSSYSYNVEQSGSSGELENLEFLPDDIFWSEEGDLGIEDGSDNHIVGGYTQMDLEEAQNDPEVQNLLNFGVQEITNQEALAQKIPDATYTVSQLRSVWTQVVSGINYRFDVDITNDLGWVLRATFVVYSQAWTDTQEVSSYVYAVTTNPNPSEEEEFVLPNEEDITGAYEPIDPSQLDTDSDLQDSLEAGVRDVVAQAVIEHALPDSTYEVTQIHSIYGQVVSGMNYRFDVDLTNCAGLVARAVFVVYSEPWTSTLETTPGTLEVTSIPEEGLIGGNCPNTGGNNEEELDLGEEEEDSEEDGQEDPTLPGGWSTVDPEDAQNDEEIQNALNVGVQKFTEQAIANDDIQDEQYRVDQVNKVEQQVVNGMNYRFDVDLVGNGGSFVKVILEVYSQPRTNTVELTSSRILVVVDGEGTQ